jgi:hypothetical protein
MIKLKDLLTEKRGIGGYYLMKMLKDMANDVKRDDKKLYKALMFLHDRINQSARDVDLDADDLNDFLNDPRGRKYAKDLPDWMIDDLFEGVNEIETLGASGLKSFAKKHKYAVKSKKSGGRVPLMYLSKDGNQFGPFDPTVLTKKYLLKKLGLNERKFHHKKLGDNYLGGYNDNKGNNTEMWGAKDGTFYIWVQKPGGAEAYIDLPKNVKDRSKADKIHHKITKDFKK